MKEVTEGMIRKASGLDYWNLRYERHHVKVPGFGNTKEGVQDIEYQQKIKFIQESIDFNLKTLDYGCGIGRYAPLFNSDLYYGYDPISKAIEIAKQRNPGYKFSNVIPYFKPDQILFCTVLQHIKEPKIQLGELSNPKMVIVYENTSNAKDKNYIFFRKPIYYKRLIFELFGLNCVDEKYHFVNSEKHTLMVFE